MTEITNEQLRKLAAAADALITAASNFNVSGVYFTEFKENQEVLDFLVQCLEPLEKALRCDHCGGSGWIRQLGGYTSPEEIVTPCPNCTGD